MRHHLLGPTPFLGLLALGALIALALLGALFDAPAAAEPPDPTPGATLPTREQNLDDDGLIRVHEQGIAKVDVTNTPLDVQGSVDVDNFPSSFEVSNFPSVQDVNVTGGELSEVMLAPVTIGEEFFIVTPAGSSETAAFGATMNVTTVFVVDALDEVAVDLTTSLTPGGAIAVYSDLEGGRESGQRTFFYPVPADGVEVHCFNESDDCQVSVEVLGF